MKQPLALATMTWIAGLCLSTSALAQHPAATLVDIGSALTQAAEHSGKVRAAQYNIEATRLRAEALEGITRPAIGLTGAVGRGSGTTSLDTSRLAAMANPAIGLVNGLTHSSYAPVPQNVTNTQQQNIASLGVNAVWPLYTGGRLEALQGSAQAKTGEAQAEWQETQDQNTTLTTQRYFVLQLAQQVSQVRAQAQQGLAEHQRAAQKLEAIGLLPKVERLKADAAFAAAQRDLTKARNDLATAQIALQRQLDAPTNVKPTTALFVHSEPVGDLPSFIDLGLAHHPAWAKLSSKREQAVQAQRLAGSEHSPTVLGVGQYNGYHSNNTFSPNWFAGVVVNVPLIGGVNHRKNAEAARLDVERVQASAEQAQRDIPTLIESQWRATESARAQYLALVPTVALAEENLRLQKVAFANLQATTLDVTDATLNLAKAQTERVQAAYDYVIALSRLLEACGQPQRLPEYARSADIQLALQGQPRP